MYEKIITVSGTHFKISSTIPITPEIEADALHKLGIQILSATCPASPKTVGSTTILKCTPVSGAGTFTVTFYKDGVQLKQYTGVLLNTEVSTSDANSVAGTFVYSVTVSDGCADPQPQVTSESCTVVYEICPQVQCNLIVV